MAGESKKSGIGGIAHSVERIEQKAELWNVSNAECYTPLAGTHYVERFIFAILTVNREL